MPTARPARRYDSPSSSTDPTASRRTSNDSGGVPPWPGGRGGSRWARRAASQSSTVAGREERGQYAIGDQTSGQASRTRLWSGPRQRPDAPSITDTLIELLGDLTGKAVGRKSLPKLAGGVDCLLDRCSEDQDLRAL